MLQCLNIFSLNTFIKTSHFLCHVMQCRSTLKYSFQMGKNLLVFSSYFLFTTNRFERMTNITFSTGKGWPQLATWISRIVHTPIIPSTTTQSGFFPIFPSQSANNLDFPQNTNLVFILESIQVHIQMQIFLFPCIAFTHLIPVADKIQPELLFLFWVPSHFSFCYFKKTNDFFKASNLLSFLIVFTFSLSTVTCSFSIFHFFNIFLNCLHCTPTSYGCK